MKLVIVLILVAACVATAPWMAIPFIIGWLLA